MYTHDIIHECLGKAFQSQAEVQCSHIASVLLRKATVSFHLFTCFYLELTPDTLWLHRPIYSASGFPLRWDALWRRSVYIQTLWAKDRVGSSSLWETWTLLEIFFSENRMGKQKETVRSWSEERENMSFSGLEMRILLIAQFESLQNFFFFRLLMHVNALVFS